MWRKILTVRFKIPDALLLSNNKFLSQDDAIMFFPLRHCFCLQWEIVLSSADFMYVMSDAVGVVVFNISLTCPCMLTCISVCVCVCVCVCVSYDCGWRKLRHCSL